MDIKITGIIVAFISISIVAIGYGQNEPKSVADVFAEPGTSMHRTAERARAVERIRAIENAGLQRVRAKAKAKGVPIRQEFPDGTVTEIVGLDENGDFQILTTHNANSGISSAASLVHPTPYNLDGSGVTVGVWEPGGARTTHTEFQTPSGSRVVMVDGDITISAHATHVIGTIAAAGVDPLKKGMAPNVNVAAHNWSNVASEMTELAAVSAGEVDKIPISNHSYGFYVGWRRVNSVWTWGGTGTDQNAYGTQYGRYTSEARDWDALAFNAQYYLIFQSAGNENSDNPTAGQQVSIGGSTVTYNPAIHPRGDGLYRNTTNDAANGYENISHRGNAKNIITVGSVNDAVNGAGQRDLAKATLALSSSRGPTDDGRIKPDIVANGVSLRSTGISSDTVSNTLSGTSMAAPSAAGSASLLVDQYRRLFPGSDMRASTLKGLIIHTADDLGNPGPDYHYGWGLINVKKAADVIIEHHANLFKKTMIEDELTASIPSRSYSFNWDGSSPIRATLSWTDPAGGFTTTHDLRSARLVNDLDIKLVAPGGTEYFPFVMPFVGTWTVASMSQNATTGINSTDNVEQVLIGNPGQSGEWQVVITHQGTLSNGIQPYGLIVSGLVGANISISESGDITQVTEDGATDTYTVALSHQPTANVTIALTPDSQVSVSTGSLIFTPANWDIPQEVTVTAVDDSVIETSPHSGTIVHSETSDDPAFNDLQTTLSVNITDNENILPLVNAGLIAQYNMEGNARDATDTYNGTETLMQWNASGAQSYTGGSADFAAAGASIDCGQVPLSRSATTISYWLYANNLGNQEPLSNWSATTDTSGSGLRIGLRSNGKVRLWTGSLNNNSYDFTENDSGVSYAAGVWVHHAWVFDGSQIKFYKDGSLVSEKTASKDISSAHSLLLGRIAYTTSYNFNGYLDDVRIYNEALDIDQIERIYEPGMQLWLKPEQGFVVDGSNDVTIWQDGSGRGNHMTPIGSGKPRLVSDTVGTKTLSALEFNRAELDALKTPFSVPLNMNTFTFSFAFKPTTLGNYIHRLGASSGWNSFYFHGSSSGAVYVGTNSATRMDPDDLPAGTLETGKWQIITFSFDNGHGAFYKNGVLLASKTGMALPTDWTQFFLGEENSGTSINGLIGEVAVYDRALHTAVGTVMTDWHARLINKYLDEIPDSDGDGLPDWWEQRIVDASLADSDSSNDLADVAAVLPEDDFDGDGSANIIERAFNSDPTSGSSHYKVVSSMQQASGSDYLSISYRQLQGGTGTTGFDYTVAGLTYTVEYDSDLVDPWSSGSVFQVGSAIDNGDGTETVTVRLTTDISNETKQFIRLKVTAAE